MAFRTQNQNLTPAVQFAFALRLAAQIKREAIVHRDRAVAGSVSAADLYTGLLDTLVNNRAGLETARTTPGIVVYAQEQADDPAYDIAAEFTAMMSEIDATISWLETNFPVSNQGFLELWSWVGDGSGALVANIITNPGELSALETRLNALIATIN